MDCKFNHQVYNWIMINKYSKYLEIEKLLNKFFWIWNFCIENCIKQWNNYWCCTKSFFNDFNIEFNEERKQYYWIANKSRAKCWYLWPKWCKLKTHKSPICLWFVCTKYHDFLKSKWITRNWNEIIDILGELIHQDFSRYEYIKNKIQNYIDILDKK